MLHNSQTQLYANLPFSLACFTTHNVSCMQISYFHLNAEQLTNSVVCKLAIFTCMLHNSQCQLHAHLIFSLACTQTHNVSCICEPHIFTCILHNSQCQLYIHLTFSLASFTTPNVSCTYISHSHLHTIQLTMSLASPSLQKFHLQTPSLTSQFHLHGHLTMSLVHYTTHNVSCVYISHCHLYSVQLTMSFVGTSHIGTCILYNSQCHLYHHLQTPCLTPSLPVNHQPLANPAVLCATHNFSCMVISQFHLYIVQLTLSVVYTYHIVTCIVCNSQCQLCIHLTFSLAYHTTYNVTCITTTQLTCGQWRQIFSCEAMQVRFETNLKKSKNSLTPPNPTKQRKKERKGKKKKGKKRKRKERKEKKKKEKKKKGKKRKNKEGKGKFQLW